MPRPRNKTDQWMPPRVYRGKSAFEFHPKGGGAKRLCDLKSSESQVWAAYDELVHDVEARTVSKLADNYFESSRFLSKSPRTQTDRLAYWKKLKASFGKVLASSVATHHIREYMDLRGKESEAMANKEIKFFKLVFALGYEKGWIKTNPCNEVTLFPEKGRDRYITDDEYYSFLGAAEPTLHVFMELAYICAARGQDVRKIALNDITEEGLFVQQAKTGKKQLMVWNGRLRAAVALAKKIRKQRLKGKRGQPDIGCVFLLVSGSRGQFSESGLKSLWRRARANWKEEHGELISFTYHDIKAKGISDYEGDKQNFSGHKSRSQMEKYNRSVDKVEAIGFGKHE